MALLSSTDCDIMAKADELLADDPEDSSTLSLEPSMDAVAGSPALLKRDTALPVAT